MAATKEDTEQILEDAFNQAFSPPPSRRQSVIPAAKAQATEDPNPTSARETAAEATNESSPAPGEEEIWKQEYEDQVKAWRVQSAEAREKAEKVREQWEAKRAVEREERKAAGIPEPEPEVIPGPANELASVSSSTVLVPPATEKEERTREKQAEVKKERNSVPASSSSARASTEPQPHVAESTISQPDTVDGSQKWEEIDSSTSSYPSMTFPEQTTPPLQHQEPQHRHHHSRHEPGPGPQTATLAAFDSSLSPRTRVKALASSLAINLFLPFINGVMLGLGEIFAKNFVIGWLGWGSTATTVGVSQRSRFGTRR